MSDHGVRVLADGFGLVEAPRWHNGRIHFSDWSAGDVLSLGPGGEPEVIAHLDSFPLCTDWLPDGRLLLVSSSDGLLLRREHDGTLKVHADLNTAIPGGGWNDIVVDGRGNAYVDNVADAFTGGNPTAGTVVLVTPDGAARTVAEGLAFPNGPAVTPDNATLIVAESYANRLTAFDIGPDGALSVGRIWADLGDHNPDGICIDAENAVWYADVPHRRCVRVAEGGEPLQTVTIDRGAFACALGGTTLHITAATWLGAKEMVLPGSGRLLAVDVEVPGAGRP